MEAQAVPLAPKVFYDDDDVWVSMDQEGLVANLTVRERLFLEGIFEIVRESRWEVETTTQDGKRFRVAWPSGCCDPDPEDVER
jgi:hypothetical protein